MDLNDVDEVLRLCEDIRAENPQIQIDNVIEQLNLLLQKYGIDEQLELRDIQIFDKYFCDFHSDGKLSKILHEYYMPLCNKMELRADS